MNQNPQKKSFFSWIPCFCYTYIAILQLKIDFILTV